jgi:hypothetical protein
MCRTALNNSYNSLLNLFVIESNNGENYIESIMHYLSRYKYYVVVFSRINEPCISELVAYILLLFCLVIVLDIYRIL